ncbi:hypothetical protein H6P81_012792 [Aristolochia fimbriata]|uniref:Gustatory receptor n=1 Tax=Aristolochia fimbriata TaxID=158543 RepID=A0AAV7EED5_ARIFI|nr:hypothetical protein H6P81_012792 [Aristolochia fimbriata]
MAESAGQAASEPLLTSVQPQNGDPLDVEVSQGDDSVLDHTLRRLDFFLFLFGFHQTSLLSAFMSWAAFLLVGVSIPVLTLELSECSGCEEYQIIKFELSILASQASLAAVSLLCVSHNLRKYGVRKFLFVDRFHGQMSRFRKEYVQKIQGFFRLLLWWILPVFLLKVIRETMRIVYVNHQSLWLSFVISLALIVSWAYLATIFLSACILFNIVCNLQVIHFDDYGKLLERDADSLTLLEEHMRLRYHLSKISHRFRIYLLLAFLVVTASQFLTLFQTTGYRHIINFINSGDFLVSSIVEVVGLILCLHAAAKISHRAQGVASVACRWHALVTCSSDGSQHRPTNSVGNSEANLAASFLIDCSESDLESLDNASWSTNTYFTSHMSSFQKRQALVMYLQSNPGGLTIFGWTVDRTLINTIFFIELSLVLFVLGKTVVFIS